MGRSNKSAKNSMPEKNKAFFFDMDDEKSSKKSLGKSKDKNWRNHLLDDDY
jgi:hypothetical protein